MNTNKKPDTTRDTIASGLIESVGSPTHGVDVSTTETEIMGIVLRMIEDGQIGLRGLVNKFVESGLHDRAKSWVGHGENKSISPAEVEMVLGSEHMASIAAEAGIPEREVAEELANVLPLIIDKFTPAGNIPEPALVQEAASLARTKLS